MTEFAPADCPCESCVTDRAYHGTPSPPLVLGGQGREPEELIATGGALGYLVAAVFFLGALAIVWATWGAP